MDQLFLITGTNAYAIDQECRRWRASFREKHGSENLSIIDGGTVPAKDVLNEALAAPFLAEKRLLCIAPLPQWTKDEVIALREGVHPGSILLFSEANPDKRRAAYKELLASAVVTTCTTPNKPSLQRWANELLQSIDGPQIASDALELLISMVGEDQFMLDNELRKLALLAHDRPITTEDVIASTIPMGERVSWQLIDLLVSKKTSAALTFTQEILSHGESPYSLWNSRLLWTVSALSSVCLALQGGISAPAQIAKETGLKPFTVQSLLPLARNMTPEQTQSIVQRVSEIDLSLKTGSLRATEQSPEELLAAIDTIVMAVSS